MSNDSIDIVINTHALDEAQAKAEKLLATLQQIRDLQGNPRTDGANSLIEEMKALTVQLRQQNRHFSAGAAVTAPSLLAELQKMTKLLESVEGVTAEHAIRTMT